MLSKSALAAAHCSSHRTSQTCSLDVPASCPHDEYVFEDRFEDGEEGPPVPVCLRCGLMDARILGSCFEKQHVFRPGAIECQCGRWPESEECTHRFDGESACVLCGIIANQQQMDQLVPTRPVEVLELEARIRPALQMLLELRRSPLLNHHSRHTGVRDALLKAFWANVDEGECAAMAAFCIVVDV